MIVDATLGHQTLQAVVSFSGATNIVIAGTVGKIIKVLQIFFVVAGDTNLVFKSGTTALSGTMAMLANGSMVLDYIQLPLNCDTGDDFVITSSGSVVVGGTVWYIKS